MEPEDKSRSTLLHILENDNKLDRDKALWSKGDRMQQNYMQLA